MSSTFRTHALAVLLLLLPLAGCHSSTDVSEKSHQISKESLSTSSASSAGVLGSTPAAEKEATPQDELQSAFRELNVSDAIAFKAKKEKYVVSVFVDIDCSYCRQMHAIIRQYNAQGITVRYYPWPRTGEVGPTHATMASVWCAPTDAAKRSALTAALAGKSVRPATCDDPVRKYTDLAHRMHLIGTPGVLMDNGTVLGGFVPPEALRRALDMLTRMEAERKARSDAS